MPRYQYARHDPDLTLGEMRASSVRGLLIYCSDYKCSHSMAFNADRWPDEMRLSDLEGASAAPPVAARRGCAAGF
jgi:hypothetical protein